MTARYERELKKLLEQHGFFVIRSAGSLSLDLIAIKNGKTLLIEQKTVHSDVFYTVRKKEQFDLNRDLYHEKGLNVIYAVKFVGKAKSLEDSWRFFKIDYNAPGYPILRYENGKKIEEVIQL